MQLDKLCVACFSPTHTSMKIARAIADGTHIARREEIDLTTDPAEIEKTWRVLPMGYWKGSGLSIALDLIATVLTNGNSVHTIGTFGDEIGLTQIMIAIDPSKGNSVELTDEIVNNIVADVKSSIPVKEGGEVYYPGELELLNIKQNKEEGIPLKLNSLTTELRKVWAVIKVEDTENIDPYGYDVTLNP